MINIQIYLFQVDFTVCLFTEGI